MTLQESTAIIAYPLVLYFNGGSWKSTPDITIALQDLDCTSALSKYRTEADSGFLIKDGYWVCSEELITNLNAIFAANHIPLLPAYMRMAPAGSYVTATALFAALWKLSTEWTKPARAVDFAYGFKLDNAVDPFPGLTHSANVHLYFNA